MEETRTVVQPAVRRVKSATLTPGRWIYVCPCGFRYTASRVVRTSGKWMVYCFKCKQQTGKYYQIMDERLEFEENFNGKLNCTCFTTIRLHHPVMNAIGTVKQVYLKGIWKGNAKIMHAATLTLDRIKAKYPKLPMMLCSGGSGRIDYEALQYFTEFWASDNTDPIQRLFIQYGYSFFYPAKSMSAHVTTWNKNASIKFRTDVAMMGKLGFDIKLSDMSGDDLTYCQGAVKNYKRLRPAIMEGDLYRLVSPYDGTRSHAANQFVSKDKNKAVVFAFDVYPGYGEKILPVRLEGLDAGKQYRVKEINLMPNQGSSLEGNDRVFSGDYLMKVGLNLLTGNKLYSRVVEITAE